MSVYQFDRFVFDPADGRLAGRDGAGDVHLRPQAGKLLARLLLQPQAVVDRDTLVGEIWGDKTVVDFESGLAALLRELRQAITSLGGDAALIETVPRRGYRLRAEVRRIENDPGARSGSSGASRMHRAPISPKTVSRIALTVALTLLLTALAAFLWWRDSPVTGELPARSHQLAILPLERFGDPDFLPAQAGILMADGILAALWRADLDNLELIGRAGMRPYSGRDDVVSAVAADLGVDLLIEGSVRFGSSGWQVDLRLMQVPPGRVVWSQTLDGDDAALPAGAVADEFVDLLDADWADLRKALNTN